MKPLNVLIHDRRLWLAVAALIQTVIFVLIPDFPAAIWIAIDGVIIALIGTMTVKAKRGTSND